ncbi:MAG: hypothetical protein NTW55_02165 [Planctomycetota bacterium]|nr:hypothetical protein [Planctomycetota bacterium]
MTDEQLNPVPTKPRSSVATVAFYSALLMLATTLAFRAAYTYDDTTLGFHPFVVRTEELLGYSTLLLIFATILLAFIASIHVLVRWKKYSGLGRIFSGIILCILVVGIILPAFGRLRPATKLIVCQTALKHIGNALAQYTASHGILPEKEYWLNALDLYPVHCPASLAASENESNYALNTRLSGLDLRLVPKNTVLAFETRTPRPNPFGSSDSITAANHNNVGSNVLFVDFHVEFIRVEDFNNLKW